MVVAVDVDVAEEGEGLEVVIDVIVNVFYSSVTFC